MAEQSGFTVGETHGQEVVENLAEREREQKDNLPKITVTKTWYWNWDDSLFRMFKKIFCKEE